MGQLRALECATGINRNEADEARWRCSKTVRQWTPRPPKIIEEICLPLRYKMAQPGSPCRPPIVYFSRRSAVFESR